MIVFVAVPALLWGQFRQADEDRRRLLLDSLRDEGRLVAEALRPMLAGSESPALPRLAQEVERFGNERLHVKLLFRPADTPGARFFYVAAAPSASSEDLSAELESLIDAGVLSRLEDSCQGERALTVHHRNPAGQEELLTSMTPLNTEAGCWLVLTGHSSAYLGAALGTPYRDTPEVRFAAFIYVLSAALVVGLFLGVWHNVRRFGRLAGEIRTRGRRARSFAELNRVPELEEVAAELDRMVGKLALSADAIRQASEENAHAFKTPLAVIAQSVEPVKRALPPEAERGRKAVVRIEEAVGRLDELVQAARHMDQMVAELLDPPRVAVPLKPVLSRLVEAYVGDFAEQGVELSFVCEEDIAAYAGEDLVETVVENLLTNARGFSPPDSEVVVRLAAGHSSADIVVEDRGPGVPPADLERIFERYVSERAEMAGTSDREVHFGIGLAIVRRNVEAVDGEVRAENRDDGGLRMVVSLPRA